MSAGELDDIRRALWELLLEIKADEIDAEAAEAATGVLDSLAGLVRLEQEEGGQREVGDRQPAKSEVAP